MNLEKLTRKLWNKVLPELTPEELLRLFPELWVRIETGYFPWSCFCGEEGPVHYQAKVLLGNKELPDSTHFCSSQPCRARARDQAIAVAKFHLPPPSLSERECHG